MKICKCKYESLGKEIKGGYLCANCKGFIRVVGPAQNVFDLLPLKDKPTSGEGKKKEQDSLTLKWGTLKAWHFHSAKALELLKEYGELGMSFGAMSQHDTPRQKEIICELIDEGNFKYVWNDWDDKKMGKKEAKKYVLEYDK